MKSTRDMHFGLCTAVTARVRGAYSGTGSRRTQRPGALGFMTAAAYGGDRVSLATWKVQATHGTEGHVSESGGSILLNEDLWGRLMKLKIHLWRHFPPPRVNIFIGDRHGVLMNAT